ncbi:AtpZ/AtpI family protein [Eilatimonas milleporae]|uniref:ATP synthase protein I n=1 Tax=Eilatimonas milleporae TaxID=911205 RepID=A0A3M0C478_9PROT|nr:AtpZ/AtpI family protein [Eilatimonas milleporae]RMB04624.1 F0F1-type ATP synthase assembly protein I [Eilatimonas milleporae]
MTGDNQEDRRDFDQRLAAARAKVHKPDSEHATPSPLGQAMRMGLDLVVGVAVGGLFGYMADDLFGTRPFLLILLLFLGFGAGIRNVVRTAQSMQADLDDTKGEQDKTP